jgi:putative photosynthetic complex assembly protein 2
MIEYVLPPLAALLVWWFGTGVVMLLDGLPRDTFRWTLGAVSLLALVALVAIARSADDASAASSYVAFTAAVAVWGWHELTFLSGWLTGPRRHGCSAPAHWPTRLRESVQAILWHELGLLATLGLIAALTWGAVNPVALWTFGLLWVMRLSAKLNLFLGVRNLGEEFLPPHLAYLPSYFARRPFNELLPWVLLLATLMVAWLLHQGVSLDGGPRAGHLLVASLGVLAIAEHVLMVLPLRSSALWRWAMRRHAEAGVR